MGLPYRCDKINLKKFKKLRHKLRQKVVVLTKVEELLKAADELMAANHIK